MKIKNTVFEKPVSNLSPKIHSKQRRHAQLRQCLSTTTFFKATRRQQIGLDGVGSETNRVDVVPYDGKFCWFEIWRNIQLLPQCQQGEGLVWGMFGVTWWPAGVTVVGGEHSTKYNNKTDLTPKRNKSKMC